MEGEIQKLKGLLEIKNAEIETLIQQNARNKLVSEE
jgi:predicted Holliday junction resolvase-like endonuclease